jgi:methylglutaconyl-CoA hydratase
MGGGLGLAAASDIVLANANSVFCFSEVKLGLVPAVISSFVLRRGQARLVSELMMTGEAFDAIRAKDAGLANFVGEPEHLEARLKQLREQLAVIGPQAVRRTKKLLAQIPLTKASSLKALTSRTIAEVRTSAEGQEGLSAFFNKQKPSWILKA